MAEAVRLLQSSVSGQPSPSIVMASVSALKELTTDQFTGLEKLVNAKFEGNKTALDAALKTQKEAADEIKVSFSKQYDNLSKMIDDLKDRVNSSEGRVKGHGEGWAILVAAIGIIASLAGIASVAVLLLRTP